MEISQMQNPECDHLRIFMPAGGSDEMHDDAHRSADALQDTVGLLTDLSVKIPQFHARYQFQVLVIAINVESRCAPAARQMNQPGKQPFADASQRLLLTRLAVFRHVRKD